MEDDLRKQLLRVAEAKVLVIGDIMLDRYTWGDTERVSPEAPVLVLNGEKVEGRLGGAGSVAYLSRALDANVRLVGVTGDDSAGDEIRELLTGAGIDGTAVLHDSERATTIKHRFIGRASGRHPHQILRVDFETNTPISKAQEKSLINAAVEKLDTVDALLVSDYAKGVCTPGLLRKVIGAATDLNIAVIVDPAKNVDYEAYRGATVITPNRLECAAATNNTIRSPNDALTAAKQLLVQYDFHAVMVTLDKQGIALVTKDGHAQLVPTTPRTVYDVTGAGDMVLSMVGLCQAAGVGWKDTGRLANCAASLEVERVGVAPISMSELLEAIPGSKAQHSGKIKSRESLNQAMAECRQNGSVIGFTNGCFDILHAGHVSYLEEASRLADVLIVGVNSDSSVRSLKGTDRPIIPEDQRATMLAALACVDHVVIFDESTPSNLIRAIRPDVLIKGGDYDRSELKEGDLVESYGGVVRIAGLTKGISSTSIIESVRSAMHPD